jgi:hypothetical protein
MHIYCLQSRQICKLHGNILILANPPCGPINQRLISGFGLIFYGTSD